MIQRNSSSTHTVHFSLCKTMTVYTHELCIQLRIKQNNQKSKFSSFSSFNCLLPELHILVSENRQRWIKTSEGCNPLLTAKPSLFILLKLTCFTQSYPGWRILVSNPSCSLKSAKILLTYKQNQTCNHFMLFGFKCWGWVMESAHDSKKENPTHMSTNRLMSRFLRSM